MGCLTLPALLGILVIVTILFFFIPMGSGYSYSYGYGSYETQVTKSTVQREALPPGSVVETPYFTDELGWIRNQSKLTPGMKNFYSRTGIQPYLYLTESINGSTSPTAADVEEFADRLYDELFNDEAHFLVIFQEYNDQYTLWYLGGSQTLTVMDAEASDILMDYIDKYYYSQTMTDEEFFSKAFDEASKRIMTVTRSPWISVAVIGGVILLAVIGFFWWSKAKKQKNLEAQQTKDILNTPLETFGGSEAEDLGKKYDDNNT